MELKVPTQKSIGLLIREVRKSVGMTQVDLAKEMQISQGTLSKLENGLLVPSVIEWYRLCNCTGLSYDSIVDHHPTIPTRRSNSIPNSAEVTASSSNGAGFNGTNPAHFKR
jgi:transcriptional regulator with XRE-family HTH domain